MYAGIAVTASMKTNTRLPPKRSAAMPAGSRQIAPFRTATAVSQASCTSVRPNSSRIGMPRTPNMSHTANMRVKPRVDQTRTGVRPFSKVSVVTEQD